MVFRRRPAARRRPAVRRPRRRVMRRRTTTMKRATGVPEWASCTETMTLRTQGPFSVDTLTANVIQRCYNICLSRFTRAVSVAQNYQFYRIKNIKLTFKPLADTFQAGGAGAVPYLYYMVDKPGTYQNITTVEQLKRMGAIGRRFDDKSIILNFAPGVSILTYDNNAGPSQYNMIKVSPWLTTSDTAPSSPAAWSPSGVDHNGVTFVVQQDGNAVSYRVEMQVEFQFKKPYINADVTTPLEVNDIFPDDTQQTLDLPPSE